MVNFDVHIPSGFRVIQKIYFLIYPRHNDVIIITFFNFHFESKKLEKEKENYKILKISRIKRFLGEIKSICHISEKLFLVKCEKIADILNIL